MSDFGLDFGGGGFLEGLEFWDQLDQLFTGTMGVLGGAPPPAPLPGLGVNAEPSAGPWGALDALAGGYGDEGMYGTGGPVGVPGGVAVGVPGEVGPPDNYGTTPPPEGSAGGPGGGGGGGGGPQAPSSWANIGRTLLGSIAPPLAQAGVAALADRIAPARGAEVQSVDLRTPEGTQSQRTAGQAQDAAFSRFRQLESNPMGFGLPGDINDPRSPAGLLYANLTRNARAQWQAKNLSAGQDTGAGARFASESVARSLLDNYSRELDSSLRVAAGSGPQSSSFQGREVPERQSPWAALLTEGLAPGVGQAAGMVTNKLLADWGA